MQEAKNASKLSSDMDKIKADNIVLRANNASLNKKMDTNAELLEVGVIKIFFMKSDFYFVFSVIYS